MATDAEREQWRANSQARARALVGRTVLAVRFRIEGGRIVEMSGIGDPAQLASIDIADFD